MTLMSASEVTSHGRLYRVGKHWYLDTALLQSIEESLKAASIAYRALAAKLWKPVPRSPESVDVPELSHRLEA